MAIEDLIARWKAAKVARLVTPVTPGNPHGVTNLPGATPLKSLRSTTAVTPVTPKNNNTGDESAFNERAAVLRHDGGLSRWRAEPEAAREQGFDAPAKLFAAIVAGWAERLRELQTSEQSARGQQCIAGALSFIADGWAATALSCGWSELELVGACPRKPWERLDRLGAAYSAFAPFVITSEEILYRDARRPLRRLRGSQADGGVLPWERPLQCASIASEGRVA